MQLTDKVSPFLDQLERDFRFFCLHFPAGRLRHLGHLCNRSLGIQLTTLTAQGLGPSRRVPDISIIAESAAVTRALSVASITI